MIKKFNQFNTSEWIGPVEIKDVTDSLVKTNLGTFKNVSGNKLTIGYSYILRVVNDEIVDTGMSCVDLVVMVDTGKNYKALVIKRGKEPFKGMWAIPGGNIDEDEHPIDAAVRELEEETGLECSVRNLTFVGTFDKPYRDPRSKNCVSYAFTIVLDATPKVNPGDDAVECSWIDVSYTGDIEVEMAFDHEEIIKKSILKIKK